MSEYESLRNDLDAIHTSMVGYSGAVDRYAAVVNEQVKELWDDNAALRDELHAVANRLENLRRCAKCSSVARTRAVMAEPADVAQAIMNHAIALAEQDRVRRMYPQAPS